LVEPNQPNAGYLQQVRQYCVGALRHGAVLEWRRPSPRAEVRETIGIRYTARMPMRKMRKRAKRRRKNPRVQPPVWVRLTLMSVENKIETCITIGVRILFITVVLFAFAYVCLIAALLWGCHRWRKHLDSTAIPGLDTEACPIQPAEVSTPVSSNAGLYRSSI
jgi:hypothetical protein